MISKNVKFSIIAISISVIISLVICEFVYKAFYLGSINYWEIFVPDENISWKLKPNNITTVEWVKDIKQEIKSNSLGLRDTPDPENINKTLPTIMLQGDSNILGYGIHSSDLASNLVKSYLEEKKINVNIVNGGTSGYDLQHYVLQMKVLNEMYHPNYNFIIFNLNNDYFSSLLSTSYSYSRRYYELNEKNELELHEREYSVLAQGYGLKFIDSFGKYHDEIIAPFWSMKKKATIYGIWGNSYLAYGLYTRLIARNYFKDILEKRENRVFTQDQIDNSLLRISFFNYDSAWSEPFQTGHKLIEKLIASYKDYENTKTVVVLLPPRSEIMDKENTIKEIARLSKNKMQPDFEVQYQVMIKSFDKLGIPYINLRQQFVDYIPKEELYFLNNEHVTSVGHKMIAKAISDYVENDISKTPDAN